MPTVSDDKFAALRSQGYTGATNEMLVDWLIAGGATSTTLPDAWAEWLAAKGYTSGHRTDNWFSYLRGAGHTGALSDMELQFWSDQIIP